MRFIEAALWPHSILVTLHLYGASDFWRTTGAPRQTLLGIHKPYQLAPSFVAAAYNGEVMIGEKIEDRLKLDYPKGKVSL